MLSCADSRRPLACVTEHDPHQSPCGTELVNHDAAPNLGTDLHSHRPSRGSRYRAPPLAEPDVRALAHPVPLLAGSALGTGPSAAGGSPKDFTPARLSAAVALTRLWNPEFPQVSHPRFCPGDTPLPSSGSRWPRFPALLGTMRVLRLPAPHALRLIDSPAGSVGACIGFVSAKAIPAVSKPRAGPGVLVIRISISGTYLHGQMRDLPGCLATHPMTSRRSRDPGRPVAPRRDGASGAAPGIATARASSLELSRLNSGALSSPVYASRPRVAVGHARLGSGWRAAPLPGGSRTRWVAMKGFSSSHPPFQTFAWRYAIFLEIDVCRSLEQGSPGSYRAFPPLPAPPQEISFPAPTGLHRSAVFPEIGWSPV